MKFMIDTANINEIKAAKEIYNIDFVTANPSMYSKNNVSFIPFLKDLDKLNLKFSAEVMGKEYNDLLKEALEILAINKNIVIKIPMGIEGLKLVKELKKRNYKTMVTLVFHERQSLLAALAGADYVVPFIGRVDDIGEDGNAMVRRSKKLIKEHELKCEIVAASIRTTKQLIKASDDGAEYAAVTMSMLEGLGEVK